jgi:hypothetical protein
MSDDEILRLRGDLWRVAALATILALNLTSGVNGFRDAITFLVAIYMAVCGQRCHNIADRPAYGREVNARQG